MLLFLSKIEGIYHMVNNTYDKVLTKIVKNLDKKDADESSYTLANLIVAVEESLGKHFKRRSPERRELKEAIVAFMAKQNESESEESGNESENDESGSESGNKSGNESENESGNESEGEEDLPLKDTYCVSYTAKSLLILGETKEVVSTLKSVGDGRYIPGVKGWIFKMTKEEDLKKLGCVRQLNKLPDGTDTDLPYKEILVKYPTPAKERFAADLASLLTKYEQPATSETSKEELVQLVTALLEV